MACASVVGDDGAAYYSHLHRVRRREHVAQLMAHEDFLTFDSAAQGPAAHRTRAWPCSRAASVVHYVALSRWDRETKRGLVVGPRAGTSHVRSWSHGGRGSSSRWATAGPDRDRAGWIMLTHGVARAGYSIGAVLLDLDDPDLVLGRADEPLLGPSGRARGLCPQRRLLVRRHAPRGALVIPYGCSDSSIRVAIIDVPTLVDGMLEGSL